MNPARSPPQDGSEPAGPAASASIWAKTSRAIRSARFARGTPA